MLPVHGFDSKCLENQLTGKPLTGTFPWECQWLIEKIKGTKGNLLEIGTHRGTTARELALAFPDRQVFCVDVHDPVYGLSLEELCGEAKNLPNVKLILCDSALYEYKRSDEIAFIFIDGDHTWKGIQTDTEKAMAYYRGYHGTIVWHDYVPWFQSYDYLNWLRRTSLLDIKHVQATTMAFWDC